MNRKGELERLANTPSRSGAIVGIMSSAQRSALIALSLALLAVGIYHRIRSQQSGESLDRSKEGWGLMVGIRMTGLATWATVATWFFRPAWFAWAKFPMPEGVRWMGIAGFTVACVWLAWMFFTLDRNLTDTVVTRRAAQMVEHGPYRYVRNPMYVGVLMIGVSAGVAAGTWLIPLEALAGFLLLAKRTAIEEKYLIARFGDRYRGYMARVGRFFPSLR